MESLKGEILEFIHEQLEILDTRLSAWNQPIHSRPMMAAMMFVKECMVSINDKKIDDNFLLNDWFGEILRVTTIWYTQRYGSDMLESPRDEIQGVVAAFGMPLRLQIPRISEFETDKPAIKRIVFADGVLDEEDPMEWVSPAPNLSGLDAPTADALRANVKRNSAALRQIYRRTAIADYPSDVERNLAMTIEGHVEKAAADIHSKSYGAAIWDTHLGVEKIFKVFLRQAMGRAAHIHDLTKLVTAAEQAGLPSCGHLNLDTLPSHDDANKHRYAEIPVPSFEAVLEIYEVAICAIAHVAGSLTPGPFAAYKDLYLKALPWSPKWKKDQSVMGDAQGPSDT